MNKIKIVKVAASLIAGAGTIQIVDGIVRSNVDFDGLNSFGKFQVAVARVVIGAMASAKTKEYTDAKIDEIVENWQNANQNQDDTIEA